MQKKVFLLVGAVIVIVAVAIGIYWYSQGPKTTVPPETKELEQETGPKVTAPSEVVPSETEELSQETEGLSQDISDLEIVAEDKNLDTLEEDLSAISGETPLEQELPSTPGIDVSEVENMESELSAELDGILNDLTDLEGFEEDTSLNELDSSLSGFTE